MAAGAGGEGRLGSYWLLGGGTGLLLAAGRGAALLLAGEGSRLRPGHVLVTMTELVTMPVCHYLWFLNITMRSFYWVKLKC